MIMRQQPNNDRIRNLGTLNRFMEEMFRDDTELHSGWIPSVDVKETSTAITFFIELPGMKQEDIEVEMVGEMLNVRGKREFNSEERRDDYVRLERNYGSFQRSFTIGVPVKSNEINAQYKDGVLTVRVPKADEVQPRKIAISGN